jgi:hypothetical protein
LIFPWWFYIPVRKKQRVFPVASFLLPYNVQKKTIIVRYRTGTNVVFSPQNSNKLFLALSDTVHTLKMIFITFNSKTFFFR